MNIKMQTAINDQIQKEFYSAYLYLAMSSYCEEANLPGFAKWLEIQFEEETEHAMKLKAHLIERGAKVQLGALAAPPSEFGEPVTMFKEVLKHEQYITASIHALYEVAVAEKDYAAQIMLQWFINEQVEEEDNASTILAKLEMIGDNKGALFVLDKELGQRED